MVEKKKYRIVFDRGSCIGAAVCAATDEANFRMNPDGKADLLGGKQDKGAWVTIVLLDEKEKKKLLEAAQGCPVNVIHVFDAETGKQLV